MKETAYDPAGENTSSPAPGMAATDTHNPAAPAQDGMAMPVQPGMAAGSEEKPGTTEEKAADQ